MRLCGAYYSAKYMHVWYRGAITHYMTDWLSIYILLGSTYLTCMYGRSFVVGEDCGRAQSTKSLAELIT